MFGIRTAITKGAVQRVTADGVVIYADDNSVGIFLTFDQVDAAKAAADGERQAQIREGRRKAVTA